MANGERFDSIRRSGLVPNMADPAFDRHCRIIRAALSVDTVFFSVVDEDRQFFPSHIGLPEPYASSGETPMSHSFCQHVVRTDEPLIIHDSATEPLVADNPARHDLSIASYLGVPVHADDGAVLGTVCATASSVREWSDGDVELLNDVAASVEAELSLRAKADRLHSLLSGDQMAREYEEALNQISVATNRLQTIQSISDELAERVAPAIGAEIASIAIVENHELQFTHGSAVAPSVAEVWTSAPIDADIPMSAAVTSGRAVHLADRAEFAAYPLFVDAAERLELGSFRAIPFGDEALGLFGVLGVGWKGPMAEADVPRALDRIVELAQSTLTRAWHFESERNQARVLERVVLPTSLPETSIYDVAGVYIAPDVSQRVGGDVYDVIVRTDGAIGVMIADAVGHDLTATRAAARLRHAIGVLVMEGYSPAQVMGAVNRYVSASPSKRLVTCVCLLFAADGSSVTVANAGHPQPVLRSANGAAFIGPVGETLLGRGAVEYSEQTISIDEGDFVLCFTDGLIDRRGQSFIESERWLIDFVGATTQHDAHGVTEQLHAAVADWAVDDDVAFLVVTRRLPNDLADSRWTRSASEVLISELRNEIGAWADAAGIDDPHDLVLVATELVTNARNASQPDDEIVFRLHRSKESATPALLHLEVRNRAAPFAAPSAMPDASSIRGRGLAMAKALTRSLSIESEQGWIVVTALLDLPHASPKGV